MSSQKNNSPIVINNNACIGCENCVSFFPDHFEMKDGKAVYNNKGGSPSKSDMVSVCPVGAIQENSD